MRLLEYHNNTTFRFVDESPTEDTSRYAILSHTWGKDTEEVTFEDISTGSGQAKAGYQKLIFCAKQASKDGLRYFWVDTCCINKPNHTELSEAIISMFRWYHEATVCYGYLSDVEIGQFWESSFRKSRWFTRGWTLQELLAPRSVEFYSKEGEHLGSKRSLEQQVHEATGIPVEALRGSPMSNFSVDERMLWAANRQTKRKEDKAYSLLGIFGVYMPFLYGEGDYAFTRLEEAIRNSKRQAQAGIQWQARHAMPSSIYHETSDHLAKDGYRLKCVSNYIIDSDLRFAAIWVRMDSPNLVAKYGMTGEEYQEQFEALVADGFRLRLVNGYTGIGRKALYTAVWDKSVGTVWVSRHGMTSTDYQMAFDTYISQGYRLRHVSGYAQGNQPLYAALWDKSETEIPWVAAHGVTSSEYQQEFDKYVNRGFRLVHVCGYVVDNEAYYAAIWDKSHSKGWFARHGLTATEYQSEQGKWVDLGYRLAVVSGYTVDFNQDLYAALWVKD
ncbi:uncharacterized protein A1O5_07342 [Cladophialophora psammophila CBS 110553]|uniref:Heterokaryon incompatibility domain-containing protein n=1 Tax=Cladophialophora psammophila CBS 110553 TaxID=1182543 RepID=W9WXB8_9EURO|nr:uncharacterized protein A1O5_07342 [Cladophialophora psammophila CBS 110553]EXJ69306.1 hypothetical protein A1O5_07342 [Cladophialophora psammophila CBS 110553]